MSKKKIIILALSIMIIAVPAAGCRDMEMTDETTEPESVSEVTEIPETEEQTTTETTAETTTTTTTKNQPQPPRIPVEEYRAAESAETKSKMP